MIYLVTTLFCALGLAVVTILFSLINALSKNQKLNKHRSKQKGFADLLNYASLVDDGIILGKDGSLSATYKYVCEDSDSSTDEDKELLSARLNHVFARLGNGWLLHIDAIREEARSYFEPAESHFNQKVAFAIDDERRQFFNQNGCMYESNFYLTITYLPPLLMQQKFVNLMYEDNQKSSTDVELATKILNDFKTELQKIENSLNLAVKLERLHSHLIDNVLIDEQLSFIQRTVTDDHINIRLPKNPIYLDNMIGCKDFISGIIPKIGNKYIQCIAIEGLPVESTCCMLNALTKVDCSYRWNSRFIFLDQHEALSEVKKYQRKWKQRVRGMFDQLFDLESRNIDQDALAMEEDADDFLEEINSQLVTAGYYTSVIVLFDTDRANLDKNALKLAQLIEKQGFVARIESINNMEAYFGSLPTNGIANIRRPLIHTLKILQCTR